MMKVVSTYHSERGHRQDWGGIQPGEVEQGQPPTTCLSHQGSIRLHANGLIFYSGLACKSSRAKPHCNTKSHRLYGFTSLARYRHRENRDEMAPVSSLVLAFQVPSPEVFTFSHFSQRLTKGRVLTLGLWILSVLTIHLQTHLSRAVTLLRKTAAVAKVLWFLPPRYSSLHIHKHLEVPQTSL